MILRNKDGIEINKREVYRYLGYKGESPTGETAEIIDSCISDIVNASEFRSFYQRYPLWISDEEGIFRIGNPYAGFSEESDEKPGEESADKPREEYAEKSGVEFAEKSGVEYAEKYGVEYAEKTGDDPGEKNAEEYSDNLGKTSDETFDEGILIESKDLWKNLKDCVEVFVFGATIGIGTDRLIARANISSMTKSAIYQAAGAAYIEDYCDEINKEINDLMKAEGKATKPRFSPGYGDFDLRYQREIFRLLNLTKHTGISLSDGMLMIPSKSVTAIIGVTCNAVNGSNERHNCSKCNLTNCAFRE